MPNIYVSSNTYLNTEERNKKQKVYANVNCIFGVFLFLTNVESSIILDITNSLLLSFFFKFNLVPMS